MFEVEVMQDVLFEGYGLIAANKYSDHLRRHTIYLLIYNMLKYYYNE